MPHRWKSTNIGCLKLGQGKKKQLIQPGKEIPEEFVGDKLLARLPDQIEEFVREKVIKKPKPELKKGEKK